MQNAAEDLGSGVFKYYVFVVFRKVLLIMFIVAVSHGRVLLPVFRYVAGGSIYVIVADVVVDGGGLAAYSSSRGISGLCGVSPC